MHMEPTIADIVAPNVAFNLSMIFDDVGEFKVTASGTVYYPATITCQRTGRRINLDESSIDRVLFNRRPRSERDD